MPFEVQEVATPRTKVQSLPRIYWLFCMVVNVHLRVTARTRIQTLLWRTTTTSFHSFAPTLLFDLLIVNLLLNDLLFTMSDIETYCSARDGEFATQICNVYDITTGLTTGLDTFFLIYAVSTESNLWFVAALLVD
jgi:hypothetical protein